MHHNVSRFAFVVVLGAAIAPSNVNANSNVVRVAVYRGPASCDDCSETAKKAIENLGAKYRVDFVGATEKIDITPANLSLYDVYVQPGGGQDIPAAFNSLGDKRVEAIQRYVASGGRYLGLCMGAYLASGSGFGLVQQELDSEIGRPGFSVKTIDSTAIKVRWAGKSQPMFYQDGPYMMKAKGDPGFRSIATYQNGDIAAARYSFGKGVVVLSGPHPEADKSWFEEAGMPLEKAPDNKILMSLFKELDR